MENAGLAFFACGYKIIRQTVSACRLTAIRLDSIDTLVCLHQYQLLPAYPYYIILRISGELAFSPQQCTWLVQQEVPPECHLTPPTWPLCVFDLAFSANRQQEQEEQEEEG